MPTYDYKCPAGHRFEQFRSISRRNDPATCPECGKPAALIVTAPHLMWHPDSGRVFKEKRRHH